MKKLIEIFLNTYGIEVSETEDIAVTELMMDNHKCIEWLGKQYYINENTLISDNDDELIYEFLTTCYEA